MGLPPTWLNLTCYTGRIPPDAGFVQLRFSQHQAFFQTKPQRVKKAASGHSFPYPVTPLRTNLTTCAMRQPRTGLACPPHFSRVRTKSIIRLLYHNIMYPSIVHSTFCIHLVFFGKWAHLSQARLPFLPNLLRPNLLRPDYASSLPPAGAAVQVEIFPAGYKKVRSPLGSFGHFETRTLYRLRHLILSMAV